MSLAPSSSSSPLFSMVWAWEAGHGSISSEGLWLGSTSGMSSSRRVGRASSNYAKPGGVEDLGRRTKQGLLSEFELLPHLLFFRPFNPALPQQHGFLFLFFSPILTNSLKRARRNPAPIFPPFCFLLYTSAYRARLGAIEREASNFFCLTKLVLALSWLAPD